MIVIKLKNQIFVPYVFSGLHYLSELIPSETKNNYMDVSLVKKKGNLLLFLGLFMNAKLNRKLKL